MIPDGNSPKHRQNSAGSVFGIVELSLCDVHVLESVSVGVVVGGVLVCVVVFLAFEVRLLGETVLRVWVQKLTLAKDAIHGVELGQILWHKSQFIDLTWLICKEIRGLSLSWSARGR